MVCGPTDLLACEDMLTKTVKLLYFAHLKESLGTAAEVLELPPEIADVSGLLHWLSTRGEVWQQEFAGGRQIRAAVNHTLVTPDAALATGDEIALFPPVTGG